ncbi:class I SAM-dependent DNA methyltransferase [Aureimonas sp. AU40]|uniref:class I SAM-dependent DNA methyltransferase n=1 Tax=Aureimonas sp. AU40 TaxID=1637747 RepID=UPI000ACCFE89|nr:methyltransferase [Aureimonas sp. AU40]
MPHDTHRSGNPLADRRADYAESYAGARDYVAAADLMRQAVELAPGWTLGRMRLGAFLEETGEREEALRLYRAALAEDAADPYGAGLKLAALGAAPVPEAPPPAFVAGLFDQYAEGFETALVQRLGYRVPDLLFEALMAQSPSLRFGRALDLGCGTGLMGERLRPVTETLHGVDLSPGMLDKARRKRIYDHLAEGDVALAEAPDRLLYDLLTAADVLTYLGDLAPVFARAAKLLAPGGLFAFSVEADDGTEGGYALRPSLRYAHAPAWLAAGLAEAGFTLLSERREELRRDRGEPVRGALLVAMKR